MNCSRTKTWLVLGLPLLVGSLVAVPAYADHAGTDPQPYPAISEEEQNQAVKEYNPVLVENETQGSADDDASPDPGLVKVRGDQLIVSFKQGTDKTAKDKVKSKAKVDLETDFPELEAQTVKLKTKDKESLKAKKRELEADPEVKGVDFDALYQAAYNPNDPLFQNGSQNNELYDHRIPGSWDRYSATNTRIAIMDSGILQSHQDFPGEILKQYDFVFEDGVAQDDTGHGTRVASIASARTNNSVGIAAACPACELLIAKVASGGSADTTDMMQGIRWARNNGADAINISYSGFGTVDEYRNLIRSVYETSGISIAASAGNNGDDADANRTNYPAAYFGAMGVAALNDDGTTRATFSDRGTRWTSPPTG